uniref:Putative secreted protein n=1 Tax=Ixodes ricinus TaxID=34613 RepID=A0A6B0URU3_IXORI
MCGLFRCSWRLGLLMTMAKGLPPPPTSPPKKSPASGGLPRGALPTAWGGTGPPGWAPKASARLGPGARQEGPPRGPRGPPKSPPPTSGGGAPHHLPLACLASRDLRGGRGCHTFCTCCFQEKRRRFWVGLNAS